ncbi:hypothetical protein TNCV_4200131 [Trichonephila clavipes]|uniref:Uncharacterized protein n=1 Tax=Trichonephila clavipes TaxID=2585209 RepID=A0A8X6WB15_TRICX|nr:hypothetical protein TNCV_4200131 [Trichonephila clavipes]
MEQSNKNITNTDALTSVRERNLAKENGETQANISDENMQDLDDQQPSEKDSVQPEDISNFPTEKCLENVGWALLNREIKLKLTLKSLSRTQWSCPYDTVEALKDNNGNIMNICKTLSDNEMRKLILEKRQ